MPPLKVIVASARAAALVVAACSAPAAALTPKAVATPSHTDAVRLPSRDGSYVPQVPADVTAQTPLAWVLMGLGNNGSSVWAGTKRAVQARHLCAKRVESSSAIEIEVWATYRFSECFINEYGDRECTQDDAVGHELDERPQPYVVPLSESLLGVGLAGHGARPWRDLFRDRSPSTPATVW